jgi:TniQ
MLGLSRLPIAVAPARHETVASYLTRLAAMHGLDPRELWEPFSDPQPGTRRRTVHVDRLAAITGRRVEQLALALPELREPAPNWAAWRHQPQPRCPRCDARPEAAQRPGCCRTTATSAPGHSYWIGPPDAGQPATPLGWQLADIVPAQRRHLRLVRRHGFASSFGAVLTGFLICGHLWGDQQKTLIDAWYQWTLRGQVPHPGELGTRRVQFSASRLFAAVYPEAVDVAALIASPAWRRLAAGDAEQQQRFLTEIRLRLGRPDYQPLEGGDAIAHWMKFDSRQPPSKPHKLFPDTRAHGSTRQAKASRQSNTRQDRSAF